MLHKEGAPSTFDYLLKGMTSQNRDSPESLRTEAFLKHIRHGDKEWFSILTQLYKAGEIDGIYAELLSNDVADALSRNPEVVFLFWKAMGWKPDCGSNIEEIEDPRPIKVIVTEDMNALFSQRSAVSNVKGNEFKVVKNACLAQIKSRIKFEQGFANREGLQIKINGNNFTIRSLPSPIKTYIKESVSIRDGDSSFKAISARTLVDFHNAPSYSIRNLFDHNKRTAWVTKFERGGTDNGATTFEIDFDKPVYVQSITFRNGYQKSPDLFQANQRIKGLEIENVITKNPIHPIKADITLKDTMAPQRIPWQQQWDWEVNMFKTRRLLFVVSSVYPGTRYTDLCLSGLTIHYAK